MRSAPKLVSDNSRTHSLVLDKAVNNTCSFFVTRSVCPWIAVCVLTEAIDHLPDANACRICLPDQYPALPPATAITPRNIKSAACTDNVVIGFVFFIVLSQNGTAVDSARSDDINQPDVGLPVSNGMNA